MRDLHKSDARGKNQSKKGRSIVVKLYFPPVPQRPGFRHKLQCIENARAGWSRQMQLPDKVKAGPDEAPRAKSRGTRRKCGTSEELNGGVRSRKPKKNPICVRAGVDPALMVFRRHLQNSECVYGPTSDTIAIEATEMFANMRGSPPTGPKVRENLYDRWRPKRRVRRSRYARSSSTIGQRT